jgi:uncharacterized delta-60 repeat protein
VTKRIVRSALLWGVCVAVLSCTNPAGAGESDLTFTVTYDPNGATSGTVPVDSNTYDRGATVTVLDNTGALERTGFVLIGWNLSSAGEGLAYAPGDTFRHDGSDLVLYADWRQSGSLDSSFDPGTGADDWIGAAAIQSDGKIVIAGVASPGIYDLIIDASGKILIGGDFTTYDGTSRVRLARLNPDGSLDSTFQPGGGPNDRLISMALQANGKIVIGGSFTSYAGTDVDYVARLETDGDLDTTFDPSDGPNNAVYAILPLSDNKLMIGGPFTAFDGNPINGIARLDGNGSLDPGFLSNPGTNASDPFVGDIVRAGDHGLIIVGSFTSYNGTERGRIARLWQ